jgi:hypothetical protein
MHENVDPICSALCSRVRHWKSVTHIPPSPIHTQHSHLCALLLAVLRLDCRSGLTDFLRYNLNLTGISLRAISESHTNEKEARPSIVRNKFTIR